MVVGYSCSRPKHQAPKGLMQLFFRSFPCNQTKKVVCEHATNQKIITNPIHTFSQICELWWLKPSFKTFVCSWEAIHINFFFFFCSLLFPRIDWWFYKPGSFEVIWMAECSGYVTVLIFHRKCIGPFERLFSMLCLVAEKLSPFFS